MLQRIPVRLPARYDDLLNARMAEHGVGRSEALRMFMREAELSGQRLMRFNLKRLVAVLRLNAAAIRLTPSKLPDALKAIELTCEELDRLSE